jgi:hypothetical protein
MQNFSENCSGSETSQQQHSVLQANPQVHAVKLLAALARITQRSASLPMLANEATYFVTQPTEKRHQSMKLISWACRVSQLPPSDQHLALAAKKQQRWSPNENCQHQHSLLHVALQPDQK